MQYMIWFRELVVDFTHGRNLNLCWRSYWKASQALWQFIHYLPQSRQHQACSLPVRFPLSTVFQFFAFSTLFGICVMHFKGQSKQSKGPDVLSIVLHKEWRHFRAFFFFVPAAINLIGKYYQTEDSTTLHFLLWSHTLQHPTWDIC